MEFEFECNISDEYANETCCDEWGAAFMWLDDNHGVEYNFCVETYKGELINSSAIYKTIINSENKLETDYSTFEHYEIDFSDVDWKEKLREAMTKVLLEFHGGKNGRES